MLIKLWINLLGQVLLFHLKPHILLFSHCSFSSIVGFASVFLLATYPNTQWPLLEIFVQKVFETNLKFIYQGVKNLKK